MTSSRQALPLIRYRDVARMKNVLERWFANASKAGHGTHVWLDIQCICRRSGAEDPARLDLSMCGIPCISHHTWCCEPSADQWGLVVHVTYTTQFAWNGMSQVHMCDWHSLCCDILIHQLLLKHLYKWILIRFTWQSSCFGAMNSGPPEAFSWSWISRLQWCV